MGWFGSAYNLIRNFNCATATGKGLLIDGKVYGAVGGLEGGVASCGSTCGVVSVGAFSIALMKEKQIISGEISEEEVIKNCRNYLEWFEGKYGTTLCRERTGISFWETGGFLRYLFPGDKVVKCVNHLNAATNYLPEVKWQKNVFTKPDKTCTHCATEVLKRVREKTEVGVERLERLSFIFDGGVALTGGACGALIAAVLDINFYSCGNKEGMSFAGAGINFIKSHGNSNSVNNKEDHSLLRNFAERFIEMTGSAECKEILGEKFANYENFCLHMENSEKCRGIINFCVDETVKVIEQ